LHHATLYTFHQHSLPHITLDVVARKVLLKCRFQFTAKLLVCVGSTTELILIEGRSQFARTWGPTISYDVIINRTKLRCKIPFCPWHFLLFFKKLSSSPLSLPRVMCKAEARSQSNILLEATYIIMFSSFQ